MRLYVLVPDVSPFSFSRELVDARYGHCEGVGGLFNLNFVKTLVTEHRRKSQNHSHRLWGLGVLALWLADWNDASAAAARARVHAD